MVHTRTGKGVMLDVPESSAEHGCGQAPRSNACPPLPLHPPVNMEQLLAAQYDMMRLLLENETRHGADQQQPRQ
jgi:hypothetical protein